MRRMLFSALFAAFALLAMTTASPALAHDGEFSAASQGDNERDKDKRAEAGQLTDELKSAATRKSKLPAVQAAVTGQAERRKELINQLAQTNPAAVLQLALSPAERDALPANVRAKVEERVTVDGELQVLHHEFEDGHSAYERKLVKGGKEIPVNFGAALGQAKPGDQVRTSGIALADDPTVVTDQMVVVQSVSAVGTTGPQHTAIILVTAPGVASHTYANTAATASLFFDASVGAKSARAFYLEASYGQTIVTGANGAAGSASDVYGPYSIAATSCDTTTIRNQAFQAADAALNFNAYHRVVLSIVNPACGGGVGTIRTQSVGTYDGNSQRVSISWDYNNALGSIANNKIGGVALHEYGHNLGVWHANALECGSGTMTGDTCASDEYGDPSDVMGNSGGYGHLNAVHKDTLGWIGTRAQIASMNGSYTLNPYEDGATNVKVLKIPRARDGSGNVTSYYYLEYRKPTANWTSFTSGRPEYADGVLVHTTGLLPLCTAVCGPEYLGPGGGGDSNIVDTSPSSLAGTSDFNDAPIGEGQSYTDTGAGVTMQVTSTEPAGALVALSFTTPKRTIQTLVYPEGAGSVSGGGVYTPGQTVTLTASPAGCFQNWRESRVNQTFPNPYTFTVTADRVLEAVFTTGACAAPPANDNFPGATIGNGQQSVNTGGATVQSGEPTSFSCAGSTVTTGRTAWYTITPAATSQITLTTMGTSFDTVLAVYTGSAVNGLSPLACNDDVSSGELTSQVQFTGQAGTSYRVQVGGYDAVGGSAVLNVSSTVMESDPRQEGAIQISGNLTVGGSATFAVAVKNYGTVATPAIHPIIDGTNPAGQPWRASTAQPASVAIQPGQTVTFTLQQPLPSPGAWTTTAVSVWNDSTGALWKALPANGQSQQVGFTLTANCGANRPKVTMQTSLTGDGRMAVQLTVGAPETGNRLTHLQFGGDARTPNPNALVDLPGIGNNRTVPTSAAIPGTPSTYTFYVKRLAANVPLTLPLTVTDNCGTWQTVVGAGTGAGF